MSCVGLLSTVQSAWDAILQRSHRCRYVRVVLPSALLVERAAVGKHTFIPSVSAVGRTICE